MTTDKGISLPINMLVILAVAVIVLLAVIAFFTGGFDTGPVEDRTVINSCCSPVVTYRHCGEDSWDPELSGMSECGDMEGDVCVDIGGRERVCSEYVPRPSECPAC